MWWLHGSEVCVTMSLEGLYIIEKQWKPYTSKNLTLGGEMLECGLRWILGTSISWGRNFGIVPPFDVHDTSLERSIQGIHP